MTEMTHKAPGGSGDIFQPRHAHTSGGGVWRALVWGLLANVTFGCGGSAVTPDEGQVHRGFAQLQVHEARLDDAVRHMSGGETCDERCGARGEAVREADHICALADELQDADAFLRCRAARRAVPDAPGDDCACGRGGSGLGSAADGR